MLLKTNKIIQCFLIIFFAAFIGSCRSLDVNINLSGRKVIYTDISDSIKNLVLLNIETNQKLEYDNFDGIELSSFALFDNGKKILVYASESRKGNIYIYDIAKNKSTDINMHWKNNEKLHCFNLSIYDSCIYFNSYNEIFAYSLYNRNLIKEYTTDSDIMNFKIYDKEMIAIMHEDFDNNDNEVVSNMFLYDFNNNSKKEIPYKAYPLDWSKDRKKLLFMCGGPQIMEYPSYKIYSLNAIRDDSLEFNMNMYFISNNEIIFAGNKKGSDYNYTNLYILNIVTNEIKQITNSDTHKEIKSTCY